MNNEYFAFPSDYPINDQETWKNAPYMCKVYLLDDL